MFARMKVSARISGGFAAVVLMLVAFAAATAPTQVVSLVLSTLIARCIVGPLHGMTAAMIRLAEGDRMAEIPARDRRDEIGAMATAAQVFKENAVRMELAAANDAQKRRAEAERRAALGRMVDEVKSLAAQSVKATDEIAAKIAAVQSGTGATVGSITTVIAEMSEIRTSMASAVQQRTAASDASHGPAASD